MPETIPAWQLYGESTPFPDLLHIERIADRAAGLLWKIRPHKHTLLLQLFFLKSGQIDVFLDGAQRQDTPPVALCIPPLCVHGFTFSPGTEGWVVSLPVDAFPELFGPQGDLAGFLETGKVLAVPGQLNDAFEDLYRIWSGAAALRRARLRAAVSVLLCDVLERSAEQARAALPRPGDPRIDRLLALIDTHYRDRWDMSDYAAALGMSVRNLSRLARLHTGLSVQALVQTHLMREACRLLAYTQKGAQEVGFELGFDDPAYFSRRFRALTGLSPTEYRQRLNT